MPQRLQFPFVAIILSSQMGDTVKCGQMLQLSQFCVIHVNVNMTALLARGSTDMINIHK